MKCQGKFKFRGLTKKDGGKFQNSEGREISYKESYSLKVDEMTEKGLIERNFKISLENTQLINELAQLDLYEDIELEFDVNIYNSRITLVPLRLL